jgi:hypothetical protein
MGNALPLSMNSLCHSSSNREINVNKEQNNSRAEGHIILYSDCIFPTTLINSFSMLSGCKYFSISVSNTVRKSLKIFTKF